MIGVWFRRDLRVLDHPALTAAVQEAVRHGLPVRAVFVATPETWDAHDRGPAWLRLLGRRLLALRNRLADLGIVLDVLTVARFAQVPAALEAWCRAHHIHTLWAHHEYEWDEWQRDDAVQQRLDIPFLRLHERTLVTPGTVRNQSGEPYKVYTAFRRAWLQVLSGQTLAVLPAPAPVGPPVSLDPLNLPDWASGDTPVPDRPVDDDALLTALETFANNRLARYAVERDRPDLDSTSQLSPWLSIGALSARQCLTAALEVFPDGLVNPQSPAFAWINELGWRDFYQHLIVAWPALVRGQPFQVWTRRVAWRQDEAAFSRWAEGRTGFPIVDAGMRQLRATGWMHNRVRMIVASFLTKDLLIHWQAGERFFMRHLVDGDFAANNGGWQWAASTGTDAQPYFRVFNPVTQGMRYDPEGEYVRRWVPELAGVPGKYAHTPLLWAEKRTMRLDYPPPMVDHKQARLRALEAFERAR